MEKKTTYAILRFYRKGSRSKIIKRGLTLEEAQEHCSRSDTMKQGVWFDGYTDEINIKK